jgi:hypothetical protein
MNHGSIRGTSPRTVDACQRSPEPRAANAADRDTAQRIAAREGLRRHRPGERRHDLTETIQPGPHAQREAQKALTRLLSQVDERRNPRTRATVSQLMARYLEVIDIEPTTR